MVKKTAENYSLEKCLKNFKNTSQSYLEVPVTLDSFGKFNQHRAREYSQIRGGWKIKKYIARL